MNVLAVCLAVLAAAGFAVSASLQHHAHGGTRGLSPGRTFVALLRRPRWVVGHVLAFASFLLHAVALHVGLLVVVQPVMVSGIVFAVPVRTALEGLRPGWTELGTVALTAVGLGVFLVAAHPSSIDSEDPAAGVAAAFAVVGVLVALLVQRLVAGRRNVVRAGGYGVSAGVLFGITAGLVKLAADATTGSDDLGELLWALLTAWPTWLVPLVGLAGVTTNQRAYRAGRLSASMPLLNIVNVLVAITFGVLVFGEVPAHGPLDLLGQAVGIALMAVGLRALAREHVFSEFEGEEQVDEVSSPSVTAS